MDKWNERFLDLAEHISSWSKDPSSKIGAVAVVNNSVLSMGYNGFPKGIDDSEDRLSDRSKKYPLVVHAEMNCIYNAANLGVSLKDALLYVYGLPVCSGCSLGVIQSGIKKVFIRPNYDKMDQRWIESFQTTADNFEETGIEWYIEVPKNEGPELIKAYRF